MSAIRGGCLCGACRYETDAPPLNVRACHCRLCQKATGGVVYARVAVPLDQVRMDGPIGWFHSSPVLRRGFCSQCGTTMFSERPAINVVGLTMGSLDDPAPFTPDMHIWTSARQPWVALCDGLPQYAEGPPA